MGRGKDTLAGALKRRLREIEAITNTLACPPDRLVLEKNSYETAG